MSTIFVLNITTNPTQQLAELKLYDGHERFLASHQVRLTDHPASLWEGLFDTRAHVERYANNVRLEGTEEPATQLELLQRLGVFLGEKVLGRDIMAQLSKSKRHRTLLIRLPDTQGDLLAAAFARVPWEMARLEADKKALFERGLVVRAITANMPAIDEEEEKSDKMVRVLLVFAEAPGSNPLAVRLERERLLELFEHDILPHRQVEIDFLCFGVTREIIEEQVKKRGGYDIVHWSGHGHYNALELFGTDGKPDRITGEELVEIFENAGGFIPHLIFLSACHSGSFINVQDWETLKAVLDNRLDTKGASQIDPKLQEILEKRKGYTGTALELLEVGVPQIVAMRYAVGDVYARRLARHFYQHLLADQEHHRVDSALALARTELFRDKRAEEHPAIDHIAPLLFGEKQLSFKTHEGRSSQLENWQPQPQPLLAGSSDLDPPWGFVGRNEELTRLALEWLPRNRDKSPIALIQGIAGLGKTSLAAEVINVWHTRFNWVFAFQSRPVPIAAETFYQRLDEKLTFVSIVYRKVCEKHPDFRVYLSTQDYSGEQRYQNMHDNMLRALHAESILLILDNFETNLNQIRDESGYRCQDPEWESLLSILNTLNNSGSRILITSRHLPAILKRQVLWIPLGPLPMSHQVQLFLQGHKSLRNLWYSDNPKEKDLVLRVFEVSRGHPLILQRLGNIATDPTSLEKVLTSIDTKGYQHLPDIFSRADNDQQREDERRYLEDVIQGAIDELIQRVSPNAQRLLWTVTLALESVPWFVLDNVWKTTWLGEDLLEQEPDALQKLRELVEQLSLKPRQEVLPFIETQEKFTVTEELLGKIPDLDLKVKKILKDAGYIVNVPLLEPLLHELLEAGLLQQERDYEQAMYNFQELVRERCTAWVETHPQEFQEFTEVEQEEKTIKPLINEMYGENYVKIFHELRNSKQPNAREKATEVGKRALSYFIRARAFEQLINFVSSLVIVTHNPVQLQIIIRELQSIIEQVPAGEIRWTLRTSLADALHKVGQLEQALPFYAQAIEEVKQALRQIENTEQAIQTLKEQVAVEEAKYAKAIEKTKIKVAQFWSEKGWIYQNWAISLREIGQFSQARENFQLSIQAYRNVSHSEIYIMGSELELLRMDIMVRKISKAIPRIERRLSQVREWWQDSQAGESLAVTSDSEVELLARILMGALDIGAQVHFALEHWQRYLALLTEIEQIAKIRGESEYIIAKTRFNRYGSLIKLGKLDEAQQILDYCLPVFRNTNDLISQAKVLSALASVWGERGELVYAIELERQSLKILETLANLTNISVSHNNLSNYLHKAGQIEEGAHHRLAEIIYDTVTENWQLLETGLRKLAFDKQETAKRSVYYSLPHLHELLNRPEFIILQRFLAKNDINSQGLEVSINKLVKWVDKENKTVVH